MTTITIEIGYYVFSWMMKGWGSEFSDQALETIFFNYLDGLSTTHTEFHPSQIEDLFNEYKSLSDLVDNQLSLHEISELEEFMEENDYTYEDNAAELIQFLEIEKDMYIIHDSPEGIEVFLAMNE